MLTCFIFAKSAPKPCHFYKKKYKITWHYTNGTVLPKLKHKKSNPKTTPFQPNSKISNQSLVSLAIPKSLSKLHREPIHLKSIDGSGSL